VWDEFAEQTNVLVGKIDCTVHKDLCQQQGVQGYPTLKYSNGYGLNKFEGGRDLESLLKFVEDNLQNSCLDDPNLCSEEETKELETYKTLSTEDVEKRLENNVAERESAEVMFKSHVKKLQDKYQTLTKEKGDRLKELSKEEALLRYVLNLPEAEEEEKEEL
jgi:thioredoxin-like negative regulator of GroEL